MPEDMAPGIATVAINSGGTTVRGSVNIVDVYPNLFDANVAGAAAVVTNAASAAGPATMSIFGSGMGNADASMVTATIGGEPPTITFAGHDAAYPGRDRFDLVIPSDLAGAGRVDVVVKVNGKRPTS